MELLCKTCSSSLQRKALWNIQIIHGYYVISVPFYQTRKVSTNFFIQQWKKKKNRRKKVSSIDFSLLTHGFTVI